MVSKKPTRDDLKEAVVAARDAAGAAEHAAHAASVVADHALAALEGGETDSDDPLPDEEGEAEESQGDQGGSNRGQQGPAAQATGHGMMRGGGRQAQGGRPAFEQFMAALKDPLRRAGKRVRVTEIKGWVKIEGQQGHKVYISKTKTGVSRVESTLDPSMIEGAQPPDRPNGRIASWIPAYPDVVGEAIGLLAELDEPIGRLSQGQQGGGQQGR